MNITEINELQTVDSHHYAIYNRQIADKFPTIPIFTSSAEIPQLNEIKTNKLRIKRIINKFIKKNGS